MCNGFQHMVLEFVRDVLGVSDAAHEEVDPAAPRLAVTALSCTIAGQEKPVRLIRGTRARGIYKAVEVIEPFYCNYGLNPEYREPLEQHGLIVSGVGEDGEVRLLELAGHPFFLATHYVPVAHSAPEHPHPLVTAFATAASEHAAVSA